MKNKIFISINIPSRAKKRLNFAMQKWQDLPIKWVKEADLQLNLISLGVTEEDMLFEICKKVKNISEKEDIFDLEFDQIKLFPSAENPKSIVLMGKISEELKNLINSIEEELELSNVPRKTFYPHITLGRVRKNKWEELESKIAIEEKSSIIVTVTNLDIMTYGLGEEGGKFAILESCPLK